MEPKAILCKDGVSHTIFIARRRFTEHCPPGQAKRPTIHL